MTNGADAIRKTLEMLKEASLAMTPVGSGKIRQVEKPPKAPKSKAPKASAVEKPVDPGKSGSKSAAPKKKTKKSSKRKDEHIEGDSHVLNFKHGDQNLTGWIEDRGDGTFDVAIVCGKFTVVKGATKDTVAKKVKAAAAKLCGGKEIEEGTPDKAGEDMLYDPETEEKIDGEIEDNDDEEANEKWVPWMFRKRDKKNKKSKKKIKEWKIDKWSPQSKGLPLNDRDCQSLLGYIETMKRLLSLKTILSEIGLNEMLYNKLIERVEHYQGYKFHRYEDGTINFRGIHVSPIAIASFRRDYGLPDPREM